MDRVPGITSVLEAGDAWRERCFLGNGSILTEHQLWTIENLNNLTVRFSDNPILGSTRDFLDKLKEQLTGAQQTTIQLAAEVLWFLHLFPGPTTLKADTKREQIISIWSWSGEGAPISPFLDDAHLHGVGNPGTAYFTRRDAEYDYVVRITTAFKSMLPAEQSRLVSEDVPWRFVDWLDGQPGSDRRLARGALLYFLFPDRLERNLSKDHKRQIYEGLKSKLSLEGVIKSRSPSLPEYDRAISQIRATLEKERGTQQIDFYDDETKNLWFSTLRDASVKYFTSWMNIFLKNRGLQLNQSGRDVKKLDEKRRIETTTGFWVDINYVTSKPPRWLLHLDATGKEVVARVPTEHRSGAIGFANTKGGDSGALAVRILPVFKIGDHEFQVVERWEWLLLFCFESGLEPGSSGEAFDNFDVATGVLTYLKRKQPYIFGSLLCLNSPDEQLSLSVGGIPKVISYREATEAISKLIHFAPSGGSVG